MTGLTALELGIKTQCEFVDVEASLPLPLLSKLAGEKGKTKTSRIISSLHDYKNEVNPEQLESLFQRCVLRRRDSQARCLAVPGRDVVKVVGFANAMKDVFVLQNVVNSLSVHLPVIAILAGPEGSLSRVLNSFMTPVTHPLLPQKAAPGILTSFSVLPWNSH